MNQAVPLGTSFTDALQWFLGNHCPELPELLRHTSADTIKRAADTLSHLSLNSIFLDLLPYILELHGPGSRLSVMRDPSTRTAREAKRKRGIFYTPSDLAEYMAAKVIADRTEPEDLRYLDPSCGSGVYLLAVLNVLSQQARLGKPFDRFTFATTRLYGIDISPLAVESSAFVLLHNCMPDVLSKSIAPWAAWHALRLNLVATDSLKVTPAGGELAYFLPEQSRDCVRDHLLDSANRAVCPIVQAPQNVEIPGYLPGICPPEPGLSSLSALFPEVNTGFDVLLGNPPYADLGPRSDRISLEKEYHSLRALGGTSGNLYPLFIEMMWRLTRPGCSTSSLVVPLSVSFHQGTQYRACRHAMQNHGGRWRCAFFDREPHALFGEDVKTRNTVLFRSELSDDPPREKPAVFETGPLQKWTSRTRNRLFTSIEFTALKNLNATEGLPKICGDSQAKAFAALMSRTDRLRTLSRRIHLCQPREATLPAKTPKVFVASTAYNFLNVYRSLKVDGACRYPLSENTVHCLDFMREEAAELAFAVLSSRLTFWLWHAQGDGFHVSARFVQHVPFGIASFSNSQELLLREAGRNLWAALQDHRIVSVNRGKQTVAYRPLICQEERDAIDSVLLEAAHLPKRFAGTLRDFVRSVVVVDESDNRRRHLKSLFENGKGHLADRLEEGYVEED